MCRSVWGRMNLDVFPGFSTPALASTEADLIAADAEWIAELASVFGSDRIDEMAAQRAGRGEGGSRLRHLYDARESALAAWRAARGMD
ncbi:hypothetical protein [Methylobacterium sp. WCS2018Hpa-22]|uniref:hypothetical protein n=2 Tax=Methylobacterium TaxID=407 RepID=UPI00288A458C|nr:hypothetical protein [Methylobacterium sp. WCS2018Hpa-22]